LILSEDSFRDRREIRDFTEECIEEARYINIERRVKLFLQRIIEVFPVLERVDEAARVEGDWSLVRIG